MQKSKNLASLFPLVNSAGAHQHSGSPTARALALAAGTFPKLFQKIPSAVNKTDFVNCPQSCAEQRKFSVDQRQRDTRTFAQPPGGPPTAFPAQRNKTCVILLRSLAQKN
jgi:hypothetical protein